MRAAALDLLRKEQRLQQIVRLVGPDALPGEDRLVLMVCEMIKGGFLQQNAFDPTDVFSCPEKQVQILRTIVDFHERAVVLLRAGISLSALSQLSCRELIVRMKTTYGNEDVHKMQKVYDTMCTEFDQLSVCAAARTQGGEKVE